MRPLTQVLSAQLWALAPAAATRTSAATPAPKSSDEFWGEYYLVPIAKEVMTGPDPATNAPNIHGA